MEHYIDEMSINSNEPLTSKVTAHTDGQSEGETALTDEVPVHVEHRSQQDVYNEWATKLRLENLVYVKKRHALAKMAKQAGTLETIVNGVCEERKPYYRGDYIMIGSGGNRYIVGASAFGSRYHRHQPEPCHDKALAKEGYCSYAPRRTVWVHRVTEDDILGFPTQQFIGSWGSAVKIRPSDYLAMPFPEGNEVYAIPAATFLGGYQLVRGQARATVNTSESVRRSARKKARALSNFSQQALIDAENSGVSAADLLVRTRVVENENASWPECLLHPHRARRLTWDMLMVLLIFYSVVSIPFVLAFDPPSARPGGQGALVMINRGIDGIFMVDVVLNFFTAIDDAEKQVVITDLSQIRSRYLRGWFIVDVLSAFPIDMAVNERTGEKVEAMQMAKSLKIFRLLRVVRIFRVLRIQRILARMQQAFIVRHHIRHLISGFTIVLLLAHWCTCAFYGAGSAGCVAHGELDEECSNSWLHLAGYEGSPIGRKYIATLYWTMMTLTTVGFGDISPVTSSEQLVAIVVMIIGAATTAFGVSHVVQMTNEMSADSREFRLKVT
jgi:hypothetical protein